MAAIGLHCLLELYDCPPERVDDESFVVEALRGAVRAGFATLIAEVSHKFSPQGVTALALIAESHVAIHTWPEHDYVAADVFTCGDTASAEQACAYLVETFEPRGHTLIRQPRGETRRARVPR